MEPDSLHYISLMRLSRELQRGIISSAAVTEALLARIAAHDDTLKSYEVVLHERALARAHQADRELRSGLSRGLLHGIPIALKDLCFTNFAPTAAGMTLSRNQPSPYNATVVERLEQAGAVLLGKLTMTEAAYATHHPEMPTPVNPWNSAIWTGASSSGSGVATAAGLCFASLGSDTGGSIRYPSAACGITGVKPTWGRVSRYGIRHLSESLDHIGPMTRTAADAAAILAVIAGFDQQDPTSLPAPVPDYVAELDGGIRGLRIGLAQAYAFDGLDAEVAVMLEGVKDVFASLGARFLPVTFPETGAASEAWGKLVAVEAAIAHETSYPSHSESYGANLRGFLERGRAVSVLDLGKANITRAKFAGRVAAMFDDIDVLLVPTMTTITPTTTDWNKQVNGELAGVLRYMTEWNFTGQPAITLNGGFDSRGMPNGFQLVGKHLAEALLLRVGHTFQSVTDWHTRHPGL